jgi:hypothetical protein
MNWLKGGDLLDRTFAVGIILSLPCERVFVIFKVHLPRSVISTKQLRSNSASICGPRLGRARLCQG